MKKYTFTTALIALVLFGLTTHEFWLGLAIASLLLTPILQGIVDGWQGKPKEKIESNDNGIFLYPWWWD